MWPPLIVGSFAGLDGSGSHREIGKSKETSIISVMFGASHIREFTEGEDLWNAIEKGHSSPRYCVNVYFETS